MCVVHVILMVTFFRQELNPVFMTFHDNKPLEQLVNENWNDFNKKVNVTIADTLSWQVQSSDMTQFQSLLYACCYSQLVKRMVKMMVFISILARMSVYSGKCCITTSHAGLMGDSLTREELWLLNSVCFSMTKRSRVV